MLKTELRTRSQTLSHLSRPLLYLKLSCSFCQNLLWGQLLAGIYLDECFMANSMAVRLIKLTSLGPGTLTEVAILEACGWRMSADFDKSERDEAGA